MRIARALVCCLIGAGVPSFGDALRAAEDPPGLQAAWKRLDEFVRRTMREDNIPGVSLALTDRRRLLHVATYGFSDLEARRPLTPDHLLEIGSITKSFTSIALLQLHDEGRFDPRAPVTTYLPWFKVQTTFAPLTSHDLLTHTAALPRDRDDIPSSLYQAVAVADRVVGEAPGRHFRYSNIGYQVLSHLLEAIDGRPYGDLIKARVLDRLGMTHTAPTLTHALRPRMAIGYEDLFDDRPGHPSHPRVQGTWVEYGEGDGSIASTPADMAAYVRMLLNRGAGPSGRLVSEEGFGLLIQPAIDAGEGWSYGYGLETRKADGHTIVAHSGGMIGYYARIMGDLTSGLGVAIMINGPGSSVEIANFALQVADSAVRGRPLPPLPPDDPLTRVKSPADYAGTFTSPDGRKLVLSAEGDHLILTHAGKKLVLETRDDDRFYVPHADFSMFLLAFGRDDGRVVEASYGSDWYAGEHYAGPRSFDHPREWDAYVGHYRTVNPWESNFRLLLRKGQLLFSTTESEEAVTPLEGGLFRVGEDYSAERLRFDTVIGGRALQANLSGVPYYRVFTP